MHSGDAYCLTSPYRKVHFLSCCVPVSNVRPRGFVNEAPHSAVVAASSLPRIGVEHHMVVLEQYSIPLIPSFFLPYHICPFCVIL